MTHPGIFITFEGMDGSGKTTQMHRLAARLRALRHTVLETLEPGGPPVAQKIRRILLDSANQELSPTTEILLYFASRAQNVDEWITPALARGEIVLSDRFTDSSLAYQGVGRGLGIDTVQALERIACRGLKPDLTILDISLKDTGGIELLKELRAQDPTLQVLILSMHDESLYAERALRAGARGYVMKQEAPQTLLHALRKVLKGEVYVSERMSAVLLQRMVGNRKSDGELPMDRLTDREMEIFRMIGAGLSIKEIAEKLFLSAKTIEAHREHIKEKLSLKSSAELLRFAIRNAPDEQ